MCQPGNQTIYHECKKRILSEIGSLYASNKEMRIVLSRHGGCMEQPQRVDTMQNSMLVSSAKG